MSSLDDVKGFDEIDGQHGEKGSANDAWKPHDEGVYRLLDPDRVAAEVSPLHETGSLALGTLRSHRGRDAGTTA